MTALRNVHISPPPPLPEGLPMLSLLFVGVAGVTRFVVAAAIARIAGAATAAEITGVMGNDAAARAWSHRHCCCCWGY